MRANEVTHVLALATALARGDQRLTGASGPRSACLLARQALESVVDRLLLAEGLDARGSTMKTRLLCLRQAYAAHPDLVYRAETAWWRLSGACHHHAFELDPTAAQALAYVDDVAWLDAHCQVRANP